MENSRKSSSADLIGRVSAIAAARIPAGSSIVVGLSGGVDSVVLLHLLHRLAAGFSWQITALHVHHGISPNAGRWADFCAALCASLDIPFHVEHVDIAPLRAHGLEAAARKLRHAAFARLPCDFVALAHHADDQVETLLLQLLRGAGVKGASSMPVLMERLANRPGCPTTAAESLVMSEVEGPELMSFPRKRESSVVRPLLHCTRHEILAYADSFGLEWVEDESNADEDYPRNFLRHRVLPLLGEKFPAYRDTLTRSAQHFAEAADLLDDLARLDGGSPLVDGLLDVAILQALSLPRARNLLRHFLHRLGAPMPQAVQLDDMLHQLRDARADAVPCICFAGGDWQVRRYRDRVYALRTPGEFDRERVPQWQGEAELGWPALQARVVFNRIAGAGISLAALQRAPVTLRLRRGGESLRPSPDGATRTLKNLLQEQAVPPWRRERLPLLYCGDELVCVPGVAIAADYQAGNGEMGVTVTVC